ncbi:MAG: SUMF1/EgtB/PvdO family nonheme iron enzyme [Planctomycetes bacterium]|nr:SUMF1/EgtB/PvdO family nonheme iron enzyme [Planctomycetota bacterium]
MDETETGKLLRSRYRLQGQLGRGGMGAVYLGWDSLKACTVAVKELRPEYAADELLRRRFEREAATAAKLFENTHVVTVHDFFSEQGTHYIVMEHLRGGTLLDRMQDAPDGRMDVPAVLEIGRQAAVGLHGAHEMGLVHRDIKPGNLLFDDEGVVKIADFGVVRVSHDDMTQLTSVGGHPGTLVYMSPEQIDGAEVDGRSDVYSLAAVLYECLAGVRYFERPAMRRSDRAVMEAICEHPAVPLRKRVPYVSPAVEALIGDALSKDVNVRLHALEFAHAIEELQRLPKSTPTIQPPSRRVKKVTDLQTRARAVETQTRPRQERVETTRPYTRRSQRVSPPTPVNIERREVDQAPMLQLPAGTFTMGSAEASDEMPPRRVSLPAFWIDRVPVTVGRYRRFLEALEANGPPRIPLIRRLFGGDKDHTPTGWGGPEYAELCPTDDHPVVLVDWFDAYAYARWAGGRLPTEAEWERSARGLSDLRRYPWGDEPVDEERASYGRLTYGPDPVGSRPSGASADGVQDLAGNVWEWCGDRYDPAAYRQLPSESPHMAMTTDARVRAVKRGGSWTNAPLSLRVSKRGFELLATRRPNLGFRCVVESR